MTLASGCYSLIDQIPDIASPHTANIIEYMLNVFSGKEEGWYLFFADMEDVLWRDNNMEGPGAKYYNRIERAFMKIIRKFNGY